MCERIFVNAISLLIGFFFGAFLLDDVFFGVMLPTSEGAVFAALLFGGLTGAIFVRRILVNLIDSLTEKKEMPNSTKMTSTWILGSMVIGAIPGYIVGNAEYDQWGINSLLLFYPIAFALVGGWLGYVLSKLVRYFFVEPFKNPPDDLKQGLAAFVEGVILLAMLLILPAG